MNDDLPEARPVAPPLKQWVRGLLFGVALGLTAVFAVAVWLDPYEPDGSAKRFETHTQLHMAPCTFKRLTGLPCPSCGMTTSFALLVRGDMGNSLRANGVGSLLAVLGMMLIPWCLASAIRGRSYFVSALDKVLFRVVMVLLGLMMIRWAIVLGGIWFK